MRKTILLATTLVLLLACETGVKNQGNTNQPVLSGIIDRSNASTSSSSNVMRKVEKKSTYKTSSNKIFSNSAQPGYYLQMAVFAKNRPNKTFLKPLDKSKFNYIVLNKLNKDYVLIGAYKSYSSAKNNVSSVKRILGKQTFVVQVLRP